MQYIFVRFHFTEDFFLSFYRFFRFERNIHGTQAIFHIKLTSFFDWISKLNTLKKNSVKFNQI